MPRTVAFNHELYVDEFETKGVDGSMQDGRRDGDDSDNSAEAFGWIDDEHLLETCADLAQLLGIQVESYGRHGVDGHGLAGGGPVPRHGAGHGHRAR